ncbi:MAG: sodium:proton antiporter [Actinomycetota bacterium]|nr:sodium:proton antiporter [Actinomycetota bacterium]
MDIGFAEALLVLGVLLGAAAALSGWLHGTVLSISVLSVLAGITLSLLDVITVTPRAEIVVLVVELALVLTLFSDGLLVERELLEREWHTPARALAIAMPITLVVLALGARLLFPELTWAEAFLLAAVLSPTDPVITSAVVTAQRVPRVIRHTLNLESGLNDGLALPFVLFFLVLATEAGGAGGEALRLLAEALVGAAIGVALAIAGGRLLGRLPGGGITHKYEGVYALGLGFAAFGLAEVTLGNGLIAVFVAGIALAVARHEIPAAFGEFNESVSAMFQVVTFFVFGALIVATGWEGDTLALVAFIVFALVVARPAAVLLSFIGVPLPRAHKLFIAWFGPKGVATMLFALFVLNSTAPDRTLVFDIASFVVLASIMAHGLTDTVGANWIERHLPPASGDADDHDVREQVEPAEHEPAPAVVPPAGG